MFEYLPATAMRLLLAAFFTITLLRSTPVSAAGIAKDEVATIPGSQITMEGSDKVIYKKTEQGDLYLFIFKPQGWKAADKRSVIVFFHGGAWVHGSPVQFEKQCRYLASRGMVAVTVEYRIKALHDTSPRECVADAKSSIRWVRAHAGELGIDPNKLVASGGSAGGHLAGCVGTATKGDDPQDDKSISSLANAMVLYNPVFATDREAFSDICPPKNVEKGGAPAFILAGEKDPIASPEKCQVFIDAMKAKGNRCEMHVYPRGTHGFFNDEKFYPATMRDVDVFLASLGYLTGEPTIKVD